MLVPVRLALVLLLGLGACTARDAARETPLRTVSLDDLVAVPSQEHGRGARGQAVRGQAVRGQTVRGQTVRGQTVRAAAILPAWTGQVADVAEERGPGGFAQAIRLRHGGAVAPAVALVAGSAAQPGAAPAKPTEAGIQGELANLFPDAAMRVVPRPARNAYGPYGLAVGRRGDGARCLYAWQWIEAAPVAPGGLPVSLRVTLCRRDASLDALAAAMDGLRLANPVADPALAETLPQPTPRRMARARPARVVTAPVAAAMPTVAPSASDGRRYLAAAPVIPVAPPAAAGAAPALLDASLPPEAFRGPVRR